MSFSFIKQLPTPDEVKEQIPVPEKLKKAKAIRDTMIQDIFTGKSDKFLVIVGPCSAVNENLSLNTPTAWPSAGKSKRTCGTGTPYLYQQTAHHRRGL